MHRTSQVSGRRLIAALALAGALAAGGDDAEAARCLFISSYHAGLPWSDGIERGLRSVLDGKCDYRRFDMDTKRHRSEAETRASADTAREIIERWRPDVVITADDNAAKYLVEPYYRDHALPFVFCGINWTVEEYGFPYDNVTGMIEIAPIEPLLKTAVAATPQAERLLYIGADTLTESKNFRHVQRAVRALGLTFEVRLVDTLEQWIAAYREAQDRDLVYLGGRAGIEGWDDARARAAVLSGTRRLSVTNHLWMTPWAVLGMSTVAEEQGEGAGKTALTILGGTAPSSIPIVANVRRDIWINRRILGASGLALPERLLRKAKRADRLAGDS